MKLSSFLILSAVFFLCETTDTNAQTTVEPTTMNQNKRTKIIETVTNVFINTDQRRWERVQQSFADQILLDYSSLSGDEPATLTPQEITASWKELLPGFNSTHHAVSNFIVTINENEAEVFHYGTAWHHLPNQSGEDFWIVVGSYKYRLSRHNEG